eukprot:5681227-Amphidinium_carterae.1
MDCIVFVTNRDNHHVLWKCIILRDSRAKNKAARAHIHVNKGMATIKLLCWLRCHVRLRHLFPFAP